LLALGNKRESLRVALGTFAVSGPALAVLFAINLYFEYDLILKAPLQVFGFVFFVAACLILVYAYHLMVRPADTQVAKSDKPKKKPTQRKEKKKRDSGNNVKGVALGLIGL
jgi:hypothetical protein